MIPADVRIFEAEYLRLNTSVLDGSPKSKPKTVEAISENYLESQNMAFLGSFVAQGCGRGVIVAVGDRTVMGKLSRAKIFCLAPPRQLSRELSRFRRIVSIMSITFGGVILLLWAAWLFPTFPGFMSPATAVTNATSVMVAFMPEGISFGLTMTLAMLARNMIKNNTLIKNLSTVISVGTISVLAADKTGTLTLKELRVSIIILDQVYYKAPLHLISFRQLATILILCNCCSQSSHGQEADVTDIACLNYSEPYMERKSIQENYQLKEKPLFNTERRWMTAIYTPIDTKNDFLTSKSILMIKGAPEAILPRCTSRGDDTGNIHPFDGIYRAQIQAEIELHSRQGERILVVAYAISNQEEELDPLSAPLIYVGLVAMIDTPRPEAFEMMETCRKAGIRLVMMTGDYPSTATAIARQRSCLQYFDLTITYGEKPIAKSVVLSGEDVTKLTPHMWDQLCEYQELVFARTSSLQKLKIVRAFQERGHCVGVVGDGVNDTPSIRQADVGIAMGSGSEIVLQAADIILMNDNLAMIPKAVENGRRVLANTDALLYFVPAGSLSETLPIVVNTLLGIPQPLGSLLMTTISILTDLLPSIAVMAEDNDPNLMHQPPRDLKKEPLVRLWPMVRSFLLIGIPDSLLAHSAFFSYMYFVGGISPRQLLFSFNLWKEGYLGFTKKELNDLQYSAQSFFYATLICLQIIKNLLSTHTDFRSLPSRLIDFSPNFWYLLTIFGTLVVSGVVLYLPLFNTYFNTRPLDIKFWLVSLVIALAGVVIFESRLVLQKLYPATLKSQSASD
ncbi:hypothetical protein DSO57_1031841 [Entomophthora muscae]|uniref:Uncharacterized protein n=1 Tax=Entomophthora muscae TaxID=34485 RepID=A0ACC2SDG5_9FUNG|nr:hypothetical protein DSO57_1031841 [Entomophthora muscae]